MKTDAQHRAELLADPDDKRHGTPRGVGLGCRCDRCSAERDRINAERRERDRERRIIAASKRKKQAKKRKGSPKDVCTVNELLLPMMGKPSIDNAEHVCCVCGSPATDRHHIVRRGAGKLVVEGREVPKPTVRLCGRGNASGCHGSAHAGRLHFRWVETVGKHEGRELEAYVGGHWEYLLCDEPTKYQTALEMDGWRRL